MHMKIHVIYTSPRPLFKPFPAFIRHQYHVRMYRNAGYYFTDIDDRKLRNLKNNAIEYDETFSERNNFRSDLIFRQGPNKIRIRRSLLPA